MNNDPTRETANSARWRPWIVAIAAGLVGFGVVYGGASLLFGTAEDRASASRDVSAKPTRPAADVARLPSGPGRNPLSTGEMAMFVFKAPHAVPEVTFKDRDGNDVSFADKRGKVLLVNLWATWCAPCRKEMPDLDRLQAQLGGDEFEVVAISLDRGTDAKPLSFLSEMGIKNLNFYHDPTARLGNTLQAIGLPATLLIDREGREIGRLVGPAKWDSGDAVRLVTSAIALTRAGGD